MSPLKLLVLIGSLLVLSYFGISTISPEVSQASKSRSANLDITSVENLVYGKYEQLTPIQKAELEQLNKKLGSADSDTTARIEAYKSISGFWFNLEEYAISGAFALKIAELEKTENAWSIAGVNFLYGIESESDEKERIFSQQSAVKCFEQAASLDPENPAYPMYKALAYVKLPGEQPMKGILMLLELEKKYPEFLPLQLELAGLGLKTGQYEKAEARLVKILTADPENEFANCLMIDLLKQTNRTEEIEKYIKHCKQ